jgi:FkbM family methyltransferase
MKYIFWAIIKLLKIKAPDEFQMELSNEEVLLLKGSDVHFQIWYWWGLRGHEYDTVKLLMNLAPNSKSFWDVGAYFGQYALLLSKVNPKLQIVGFEPNPDTRKKFEDQIQLNKLNIRVSDYAISNTVGKLEFYNQKNNSSNSSLSTKRKRGAEVIMVDVKPLDLVAEELKVEHVDLIKIDVEHNELNVLKGMKSLIHKSRPMIVMEVLAAFPFAEAEEILVPENYSFFFITYDGLIQTKNIRRPEKEIQWRWKQRTPFYNFIFCPNEKLEELRKASAFL